MNLNFKCKPMWGYEVLGMILLRNLEEAVPFCPSKDMFVHVSTCTRYDINALTPVVCK